MAPDVADEFDALLTIDVEALPEFEPLFDPYVFAGKNPEPKMEAWRLDDGRLRALAISASAIRKRINEKARQHLAESEAPDNGGQDEAPRIGIKYSTRYQRRRRRS